MVEGRQLEAEHLLTLAAELEARGHGGDVEWSEHVTFPATPEELIAEYTWVLVNSGLNSRVALKIYRKLWPAVLSGESASTVFGHPGKAAAIDKGWSERAPWHAEARPLEGEALLAWCLSRPWIGTITRWHLAKNLGANVAKPDRWLVRLAGSHGETVQGLCERLSAAVGWRVATVDVVLWRACSEGILRPAAGGAQLLGIG